MWDEQEGYKEIRKSPQEEASMVCICKEKKSWLPGMLQGDCWR